MPLGVRLVVAQVEHFFPVTRNQCSPSAGIGVHLRQESLFNLGGNMHFCEPSGFITIKIKNALDSFDGIRAEPINSGMCHLCSGLVWIMCR